MIDALVHGRLVHRVEVDTEVIGRIVIDGDKRIQFTARRASVRRALMALPPGFPVAVAGSLSTSVASEKDGTPYVRHDLLVTALLTAEPSTSGLAAFFRKATA